MRNLKKFLALVLAMMMTFSLMVTVNAKNVEFTDDETITDIFADDLTVLAGMGVIRGYGKGDPNEGKFLPKNTISRAEMAAIVYRLVTGDADKDPEYKDKSSLYAGYGNFDDVKADDWFSGYVGYCANAGIIVGYPDGNFYPNRPVTGYETLVMLLRAMGYNQPNEFSNRADWREHAASIATTRGMLANVNATNYRGTLSQGAAREVVGELTFQAATKAQVMYTAAFGYQTTGMSGGIIGTTENPTLGWQWFGLTNLTGIIVGNQATGEKRTLLGIAVDVQDVSATGTPSYAGFYDGVSYLYGTDGADSSDETTYLTLKFRESTELGMFGHQAEIWYNGKSDAGAAAVYGTGGAKATSWRDDFTETYAVLDQAELVDYVYSEDGVLSVTTPNGNNDQLAVAAKAAGFSVQPDDSKPNPSMAHFSDRYSQMGDLEDDIETTGQKSPISTYALISNNDDKTVDVVIGLSAEVAKITQKNTTDAKPYLVLGSNTSNVSTFGDGTTAGHILLGSLTAESVKDLGKLVTAYEIIGTQKDLAGAKTASGATTADVLYQLEDMKKFTASVSSYKLGNPAVTVDGATSAVVSVNFTDHDPMKLSGITLGDGTNSEIISKALPVVEQLGAGIVYTVYEDIVGRFISMTSSSDYEFLYGTFADFENGALGTGDMKYNIVGVNWDGQIKASNPIKTVNYGADEMDGGYYEGLSVTRKDFGSTAGNQLTPGYNRAFWYNADVQDLVGWAGGKMVDQATWTINSKDAANGFVKVNNSADGTSGNDYLLTKDTNFIIVTGTGTSTLKVEKLTGLTAFLKGASEANISFNDWDPSDISGTMNQVVFKLDDTEYGSVNTANNGVITDIILSVGNVNWVNADTMYFNFDQDAETGTVLPGTDPTEVKQYELWANGEVGYYFVDTTAVGGVTPNTPMTFYTLAKISEKNGVPIYRAQEADTDNDGQGNLTGAGHASENVTYKYITVSNLNTGLFADDALTVGKVFNIAGAKVCDVEYKNDPTVADSRNEITTLLELNNAVSVKNVNPGSPVYTIGVAIVYSGVDVSCIYVTDVT